MTTEGRERRPSSPIRIVMATAVATLVIAGGAARFLGYLGPREAPVAAVGTVQPSAEQAKPAATAQGKGERKILYWRAPMNPMEIYDRPGKSQMGMDLVPVYEDQGSSGAEVRIDPVTQQNMGVRTAQAEKGPLVRTIRAYGRVAYDETRTAQVSPKFSGWLEKLRVDFTGQLVRKGEPLFDIYSPELVSAQEEYLVAYRNLAPIEGGADLLRAARQRLRYWDISEEEIRAIENSGQVRKTLTIGSPFTGVVTQKNAVEGVFMKEGTTVYAIADISRVWVEAHIYEYELPFVRVGQEAKMTLAYLPGKTFTGKIRYINPYMEQKARDVVIRLELANPNLELKPDMYSDVVIESRLPGQGILIPAEAVIRSGERNLVFVTRGDGKFSPRDVTLGVALEGGKVQILAGIAQGETVVISGQFLFDSESKLKEAVQNMMESKAAPKKTEKQQEAEDFFKE